nr:MAG TPA: hypothetical protein [Caudoviricetes sp.]
MAEKVDAGSRGTSLHEVPVRSTISGRRTFYNARCKSLPLRQILKEQNKKNKVSPRGGTPP